MGLVGLKRTSILALVAIVGIVARAAPTLAQAPTASAFTSAAPDDLAAPVKAALADAGARVTMGGTTLEFWWVKSLPMGEPGGPAWSKVAEGTLVGALRVTGAFKEIRGKAVRPGTYTLRYGLQPQNGDHLGASPFREFLLVAPAAADGDAKANGHEGAIATAKKTTGTSHPASLSLDPPEATAAPLSPHISELGHDGVIFEIATSGGPLRFGVIVAGIVEH